LHDIRSDNVSKGLRPGDKKNFQTILDAAENGDLAIIQAARRCGGKEVALICAVGTGEDEKDVRFTPLAVMMEEDPFESFIPFTVDPDQTEYIQRGKPVASQNAQLLAMSMAAEAMKREAEDVRHNEDFRLAAATLSGELSGRAQALTS
jgi:hypothetical protein